MKTMPSIRAATPVAAFLALASAVPSLAANNTCMPAAETDVTRYRFNAIVMTHPAVRAVRGVVTAPDDRPMRDVLVEVYDHPEVVSATAQARRAQRRIAACFTRDTGQFSLEVPPGSYEVRLSSSHPAGIECTSILVKVRWLAFRTRLRVRMHVAT
jgi:hypothetical protein